MRGAAEEMNNKAAKTLLMTAMLTMGMTTMAFAADKNAVYEGMDYSDVYNYEYYKANNPDLAAAFGNDKGAYIDHFVNHGMDEGRDGCIDFDVDYYKNNNADLAKMFWKDTKAYYVHYIMDGKKEGRDASAYANYNGMDYSDIYSYSYYKSNNPDLAEVFGDNWQAYIEHYVEHGMAEKRIASKNFNIDAYIANYPDLQQAFGNDYKMYCIHYISSGKAEGRIATHLLSEFSGKYTWIDRDGLRFCYIDGKPATDWNEIDGRWYYFNGAGELCSQLGIDVSSYNKDIDWQQVKNDGIEFAMIRLGYGENDPEQDDIYAVSNMNACESLGIPYGVYLYSYALTEADTASEIDHALRVLDGRKPSLGVYIDMEDDDNYKLKRNALNNPTLQNICMEFVDKFTAMGYLSGIYANLRWMNDRLGNDKTSAYPNWIAQWGRPCTYEGNYVMWQACNTGRVAGIKGLVDLDARIVR